MPPRWVIAWFVAPFALLVLLLYRPVLWLWTTWTMRGVKSTTWERLPDGTMKRVK